jgi:hypothetical protein
MEKNTTTFAGDVFYTVAHGQFYIYCAHINLIRWWILLQRFSSPFFRSSAIIWSVSGAL